MVYPWSLDYAKLDAIRAQLAALPVLDARPADEIRLHLIERGH